MKKRFKWIVSLGCLSLLCFAAAACSKQTKDDEMAERGFVISVTYDAGSGKFLSSSGITIKDYFNPSVYDTDGDGLISIKLMDPEDRLTTVGDSITVGRAGYSLAGWYTEREEVLNADGKVVDESGRVLEKQDDGTYVYINEKDQKIESTPAYTYSGLWDFDVDTLDYDASEGRKSLTLYAGWIPHYQFHYYYMENGEWTLKETRSFDYLANLKDGTDKDTIWLPTWGECSMEYTHAYEKADGTYIFPKLSGTTFDKAYTDAERTNEISGSFVHTGTWDKEECMAINSVQNIYVDVLEGERYKISTAEQLSKNGNVNGYYEILDDLDFSGLNWPSIFTVGTFGGKFCAAGDKQSVTISNVSVQIVADPAQYGGLFGRIGSKAVMENVKFENVTVDIALVRSTHDTAFGLFAGYIEEDAQLTGITIENATLKIGEFSVSGNWKLNAFANGNLQGVTKTTEIKLEFYGEDLEYYISYMYDPATIEIAENGNITFDIGLTMRDDLLEKYEKEY